MVKIVVKQKTTVEEKFILKLQVRLNKTRLDRLDTNLNHCNLCLLKTSMFKNFVQELYFYVFYTRNNFRIIILGEHMNQQMINWHFGISHLLFANFGGGRGIM